MPEWGKGGGALREQSKILSLKDATIEKLHFQFLLNDPISRLSKTLHILRNPDFAFFLGQNSRNVRSPVISNLGTVI